MDKVKACDQRYSQQTNLKDQTKKLLEKEYKRFSLKHPDDADSNYKNVNRRKHDDSESK